VLRMLLNEAGYVSFPDRKFHFYLKDHQGNTRVVADKDGNVEETNNYYPFGGTFTSTASVQPYKYNGKELDAKNGLNWYDYGARQYDAAIGRFMKVDRYSEKYLSLSPYQYGANNPVNNIEVNGDSIWYTLKDNVVTMHLTAKVINNSSDNINVKRAAFDIAFGISDAFNGEFQDNNQKFILKTDIQIKAVNSMKEVSQSDHLFVLEDANGKGARGATNMPGGKVMTIASSDYANDNWFSDHFSWNTTKTAVHEFGHAAGLTHEDVKGNNDLMQQGNAGTKVTSYERALLIIRSHSINRGPNAFLGKPYPFVHDPISKQTYPVYKLLNWK
ncbi:RHS repeat-associated core domain-containing protein, partial [Bacteroides bouchesdurhonensis]